MTAIPVQGLMPAENSELPKECYQHLFFQTPVASMLISRDGRIYKLNRRAIELLALAQDQFIEPDLLQFVSPDDKKTIMDHLSTVFCKRTQQSTNANFIAADGRLIAARVISQPVEYSISLCLMTFLDLSEQPRDESTLNKLAYYDLLTRLPNRLLFSDRLHWAISDARRQNERLAVMVIDLDHFKHINDTLGHEAGDQLLQVMAGRMSGCLREADTLSRMGGDEFTVLMLHIQDTDDAGAAAQRLLDTICMPCEIKEHALTISASIGICLFPDDGDDANQLIHNADIAMYRAKNSGRNQLAFYSASLKAAVSRQSEMEHMLKQALIQNKLEVHYQPLIDASSGHIIGIEALMRWHAGQNGIVTAGEFLPIADQLGLAFSFEDWVLQKACNQMKDWLDRGVIRNINQCRMAVNLSAGQLIQPDLVEKIRSILASSGLPSKALALEITEAALLQADPMTIKNLNELRNLGIALHLDDFSQGFNSLQAISKIPFEILKIDQIYTTIFLESLQGEALLDALLSLSHILGLRVVAEGVENQQAYAWLKAHACDGMQGFYFCKPLPALKMEMLLALPQSS